MASWTCQRVSEGVKCGHVNRSGTRKCALCGKPRPPKKRPAHMKALDMSYEDYAALNGGYFCGICGAEPKPGKKLHRDHEHRGDGKARGLLCFPCNMKLWRDATSDWLLAAAEYLQRTGG